MIHKFAILLLALTAYCYPANATGKEWQDYFIEGEAQYEIGKSQ